MADIDTVMDALYALISAAVGDDAKVFKGVPSRQDLQTLNCAAKISIQDYGKPQNTSRVLGKPTVRTVAYAPQVKTTLNKTSIAAGGTATLTVDFADGFSALTARDAFSLVVKNPTWVTPPEGWGGKLQDNDAAVAIAQAADDLGGFAQRLIAEIATRPLLPSWISVTRSGAVLTITNNTDRQLVIESHCGSTADWHRHARQERDTFIITLWANTSAIRKQIAPLINEVVSRAHQNTLALPNDQWAQLTVNGTLIGYEDVDKGAHRQDFMVSVDYRVTVKDVAYSILAPISSKIVR